MDDSKQALQLGSLSICPLSNTVSSRDKTVKVTPKVMSVLVSLIDAQGEVLTREYLLDKLWPNRVGADESLTRAISDVRKCLKSLSSDAAEAVVTIPKCGYQIDTTRLEAAFPTDKPVAPNHRNRHFAILSLLTGVVLIALVALFFMADKPQPRPSIAVLPFVDISPAPDSQFLGAGIAEDVLNNLTRIEEILVVSRTSSFAFNSEQNTTQDIAEKLNVDYVLEGTIRRDHSRVRVFAKLIETSNGRSVWANRFEREYQDLFALQDDLSEAITHALKINLLNSDRGERVGMTLHPRAYELFLDGRALTYQRNSSSLQQAEALLSQATLLDPEFHMANAQRFIVFELAKTYGGFSAKRINEQQAHLYFELQAAPDFPLKKLVNAQYARDNHQPELSKQQIREAYIEAPHDPYIQNFAINYLLPDRSISDYLHERIALLRRNPLDTVNMLNLAETAYMAGEKTLSLDTLNQITRVEPEGLMNLIGTVTKHYSFNHDPHKALEAALQYQGPPSVIADDFVVKLLLVSGRVEEALAHLQQHVAERPVPSPQMKNQLMFLYHKKRQGVLTTRALSLLAELPLSRNVVAEINMMLDIQYGDASSFEQFYGVNGEVDVFRFKQLMNIPNDTVLMYAAIKKQQGYPEYARSLTDYPAIDELKCDDQALRYPNIMCVLVSYLRESGDETEAFREFQRSLKVLHVRHIGMEMFIRTSPIYYGVNQHPQFNTVATDFLNNTFEQWGGGVATVRKDDLAL